MRQLAIWAAVAAAAGASISRGDTVWKGQKNALSTDNVKVSSISATELSYTLSTGSAEKADLSAVQRVHADGEEAFNGAEDAMAGGKDGPALTGYQAALSSGKDWVRTRAASQLMRLARKGNKFDVQEAAYVQLVKSSPDAAAADRPVKPAATTPGLDAALAAVTAGLNSAALSPAQKSALYGQQMDIYLAKGDDARLAEVVKKLADVGATGDEAQVLKLAQATVACKAKDYTTAAATIQTNAAVFTDPAVQVDALYVLAQAADGQAGPRASADKAKDLVLAYVRVVTFGQRLPGKPHVAESLLRVGELQETMADPKGALSTYKQVTDDKSLAGSPAVAKAKAAADRLTPANP